MKRQTFPQGRRKFKLFILELHFPTDLSLNDNKCTLNIRPSSIREVIKT